MKQQTEYEAFQLEMAIQFASNAFVGVLDKAGKPYILHCLKVMYLTKSDNMLTQAIAVLHDVKEDIYHLMNNEDFFEMMQSRGFDECVINGVIALSKVEGDSYEDFIDSIIQTGDPELMKVKMADLRHNSDLRRIKNRNVAEKDMLRTMKYIRAFLKLEAAIETLEGLSR